MEEGVRHSRRHAGCAVCLRRRFEEKIDRKSEDGCWLWTSALGHNGYGLLWVGNGRSAYVHRLAYEWYRGPIPTGMHVCHSCDVRNCINPDHLFLGTAVANMNDAALKGRMGQKGHSNPASRLSPEDIEEIKRMRADGMSYHAIAIPFGVSRATITNVLIGRTYAGHNARTGSLSHVATAELVDELRRRGIDTADLWLKELAILDATRRRIPLGRADAA